MKRTMVLVLLLCLTLGLGVMIRLQGHDKAATAASGEPAVMSGWLLSVKPGTPSSFAALCNDKEEKFTVDPNSDITLLGKGKITIDDLDVGSWIDISYIVKEKIKVAINIVMHSTDK